MTHLKSRKLNLGSGPDLRDGYVNVDMNTFYQPDVVADVTDLQDFPSRHYEEILTLGVLEHFKRAHTRKALYAWNRVLVPNGTLTLSTTYLNGLVRKLEAPSFQSLERQELIVEILFAGQVCEGDYHLTAFSEPLMRFYLWESGFAIDDIRLRDGWLFEIQARKETDYSFVELVHGSLDEDSFLRQVYPAVLFRAPDEAELAHYGPALRAGHLTRQQMLNELLAGEERKKRMMARAPQFESVFHGTVGLCGEPEIPAPAVPAEFEVGTAAAGAAQGIGLPRLVSSLGRHGRSVLGRLKRWAAPSGRSARS